MCLYIYYLFIILGSDKCSKERESWGGDRKFCLGHRSLSKEDSFIWHLGTILDEVRVSQGEAGWHLLREDVSQAKSQLPDPGQEDKFCEPCFHGLK